ncbi:MAG: universal stress protein [Thermoproteota archaeon]|nr:universal stress protein [Thermoproteota archaeon]
MSKQILKIQGRNKMIHNIRVTDDGTEVSDRAIDVASEIAKPSNANLTLLHVIDPIEDSDSMIFGNNKELIERARLMNIGKPTVNGWNKRSKEKIEKPDEQKIKSGMECLFGPAAEKILECADAKKADMFVMGSSNRLSGIPKS